MGACHQEFGDLIRPARGSGEICWALDFSFAGGVGVEGDGECVGSLKVLFGERTGEGR